METIISKIKSEKQKQKGPLCTYYYDLSQLRDHLRTVVGSLPHRCEMFYAMKANDDPFLLREIAKYAKGFEVASLGEVKKAREISASIPILFGGPGKTDEELEGALCHNVMLIHVESLHELRRLEAIAASLQQSVQILLRMNVKGAFPKATIQMAGVPTQFGIDEQELPEVMEELKNTKHLSLVGFHFHTISNNLDEEKHLQMLRFYLAKAKEWQQIYKINLSYLNVGGGIGVNYSDLSRQFAWKAFTRELSQLLEEPHPTILFECGRFLTAFCGYYAAEVLDLKTNHGKHFAILKGGTQHFRLPVSWQHNHPFVVVSNEEWHNSFKRESRKGKEVSLVGQLCTPKDAFARDVYIPEIRIGDVILFQQAGAYGWTISHHRFLNHEPPNFVYIDVSLSTDIRDNVM